MRSSLSPLKTNSSPKRKRRQNERSQLFPSLRKSLEARKTGQLNQTRLSRRRPKPRRPRIQLPRKRKIAILAVMQPSLAGWALLELELERTEYTKPPKTTMYPQPMMRNLKRLQRRLRAVILEPTTLLEVFRKARVVLARLMMSTAL